jgi:hypothetical protein
LARLYKRHPRGESEEIFAWVLPMVKFRKFSLGHPPEKTCKTRKNNLVPLIDVSNLCSQGLDSLGAKWVEGEKEWIMKAYENWT